MVPCKPLRALSASVEVVYVAEQLPLGAPLLVVKDVHIARAIGLADLLDIPPVVLIRDVCDEDIVPPPPPEPRSAGSNIFGKMTYELKTTIYSKNFRYLFTSSSTSCACCSDIPPFV